MKQLSIIATVAFLLGSLAAGLTTQAHACDCSPSIDSAIWHLKLSESDGEFAVPPPEVLLLHSEGHFQVLEGPSELADYYELELER